MAARSIHIADYAQALADGIIPAAPTTRGAQSEHAVYEFPTVESVHSRGARLVWRVWVSAQNAAGDPVAIDEAWLLPGAAPPAGIVGVIATESYQVSAEGTRGKTREGGKPTIVRGGKNLGKVNATNPVTQAIRDAFSRYNAQAKRASSRAGPLAAAPGQAAAPARAAGPPPMLVKKIGETREATLTPEDFEKGITVQRKYNGVRAPSYLKRASSVPGDEEVCLYSRTKGDYPGFTHIREELVRHLLAPPPVPVELLAPPPHCGQPQPDPAELERLKGLYADARVHLDGEIYKHGESLRWISGQARREDDEKNLDYIVYDCFFPGPKAAGHDMPSENRQKYLDLFFAAAARGGPECQLAHVQRAENFRAASLAEAEALRDRFLAEGYEGAIARKDCAGYRYGFNNYHSANLVKLKPISDSEFEVVGYTQGAKGKDVGAVIWICEVGAEHAKDAADKTFNVVPKDMSYEERYLIFRCLGEEVVDDRVGAPAGARATRFERDFKGRPLTVEYPERSTKTGKPTQAKALVFRTYEGGPADDPVRRLYDECGTEKVPSRRLTRRGHAGPRPRRRPASFPACLG